MPQAPKMVNLDIEETSGVDHPAHLREGWMVVKSSSGTAIQSVLDALTAPQDAAPVAAATESEEGTMPEDTTAETVETPAAEVEKAAEPSVEDFMKSAPAAVAEAFALIQKAASDAAAEAATVRADLEKERGERANAEATAYAKAAFSHLPVDPAKIGPALHALKAVSADLFKSVHDALLAAEASSESADIFAEVGKSAGGVQEPTGAYERIESMAKAAVAKGDHKSLEAAFAAVASANPDLYADYLNEKGA